MSDNDYKNAFEEDFKYWVKNPEFELRYNTTRGYIDSVDRIINELLEENTNLKNKIKSLRNAITYLKEQHKIELKDCAMESWGRDI